MHLSRSVWWQWIVVMLVGIAGTLALAAPGNAPTMGEIKTDYDTKNYQEAIKKVAAAMALSGDAAKEYDRAQLLAIKAESHLHLKQYTPASDAFNAAAKDASDEKDAAAYKATSILIRRSNNGQYQPKQPTSQPAEAAQSAGVKAAKPQPIDIVEADSRKEALKALFADEAKVTSAKIESLKKQTTLPPLMEGIKQAGDLRTIELAATDSDETCKQMIGGLAEHAAKLMSDTLQKMSLGVEKTAEAANKTEQIPQEFPNGGRQTVTIKRGLNSNDQSNLKGVISTCKSIELACEQLGKSMKVENDAFASVKADASKLATRAEEVLKADYRKSVDAGQPQTNPQPRRGGQRGTR